MIPKIKMKSAAPEPVDNVHVPPISPDQMNPVGWTYSGPVNNPDPNAPLSDPWSQQVPPPAPDVVGGNSLPQVIVRPAGWFDENITGEEGLVAETVPKEQNMFSKFLIDMGIDINPLYLALGGAGTIIMLLGFCIAGMIKQFLERKKLEERQNAKLASGPSKI